MTLSERIAQRAAHPRHDCDCRSQDEHEAALIAERRAAYRPAIPQSPFTRRALRGELPAKGLDR
jgi:hypothetical protein